MPNFDNSTASCCGPVHCWRARSNADAPGEMGASFCANALLLMSGTCCVFGVASLTEKSGDNKKIDLLLY